MNFRPKDLFDPFDSANLNRHQLRVGLSFPRFLQSDLLDVFNRLFKTFSRGSEAVHEIRPHMYVCVTSQRRLVKTNLRKPVGCVSHISPCN